MLSGIHAGRMTDLAIPDRIPITAVPATASTVADERSCGVSLLLAHLALISSPVRTYTVQRVAPTIANRCFRNVKHLHERICPTRDCGCWHNGGMNEFISAAAVKAAIKAHLVFHSHRPNAFVDVHLMPAGKQTVYVITIEATLLPPVRALLEDRLRRKCEYVQGSFLVYGNEVDQLVGR